MILSASQAFAFDSINQNADNSGINEPENEIQSDNQGEDRVFPAEDSQKDQKNTQYPYDSQNTGNDPFLKIEPSLLENSKEQDYLEVVVLSTDMAKVRELLGYEVKENNIPKINENRLQTTILEIESYMLLAVALLPEVISIQEYRLPQPPKVPENMDDELLFGAGSEPTMWNAIKYHDADNAWDLGFNGTGVNVAVLDTGVDFGHPDLNGTQARVENPASPYYGWPIAFDSRSMLSYLGNGGQGFPGRDNWYADTDYIDTDSNWNGTLDITGYNVTGIFSMSGSYHLGYHPDTRLRNIEGASVGVRVLVVDQFIPNVYDTVYVDLDNDNNFTDEKPVRKGDETPQHDLGSDGIPDRSGGMVYFIADGVNPVPYSDVIAAENGYSLPIPGPGDLVAFMINDPTEAGGNHGTLCASAVAGQGVIASGRVTGTGTNAKIIAVGNRYQGGNSFDQYYFSVEGYDGIPGTGDEAQILSCSFADSSVVHGGWDYSSRFVDNLTVNYAPEATIMGAAGNGGYGYGTTIPPGSASGVVTVGAALNRQTTDVVYWSNRGPNALGQLDPDIVSVGVSAYGDQALNQKNNGNTAYQSWSGTSLATPVAAGIMALIYDAFFQANGVYPTSEQAREILMSTADNINYDPLVQGAGFANALRATKVANDVSGLSFTPAFWNAGSYRGTDYGSFAHIMHPGDTDEISISVNNKDQNSSETAYISDYILSSTETYGVEIVANKSLETAGTSRPDFLIPLNDSINNISRIPDDTALLKVSGFMPWDEFDPDSDYVQENRFWINVYNWNDNNGNGSYWNDTNSDGVAQESEIEWSELSSIVTSSITATTQEARMHDPHDRISDGLIVGVFHAPTGAAPEITHIYIQSQCFNRTDWSWLSENTSSLLIDADKSATFNASITVPPGTPIGVYQGVIAVNDSNNETAIPVIVNVASNTAQFTFGGNTLTSDLYANEQVFGAFRWGWRYEGGDWRFYFTDIPDSYSVQPGTKILADVSWEKVPTDIDVFLLGGVYDKFSNEMPGRYGPYTLGVNTGSVDKHVGAGKFRFNTSTNGPRELLSTDLSPGLNELILHNDLFAGKNFGENLTGEIGTVNVTPYPWDVGYIDSMANLSHSQQFTFLSSLNLSPLSVVGAGVFPAMEYPNQLVYQNTPSDKTTSNWSVEFDVAGAQYIKVNISSRESIDTDLFLLRDDGDGVPEWGAEQVASSTSPYADEEVLLNNPADGKYWVFVHGWSVPVSPASFDCYIEAVYGNDLTVSDIPVGNISADVPVFFNGSVTLPPIGGETRGVITLGVPEAAGLISIPFMAELETDPPVIYNRQPADGAYVPDPQPEISAEYYDSGSGINATEIFLFIDGIEQTVNATITGSKINITLLSLFLNGNHTVELIVTDLFGNTNTTLWQFIIETQDPEIYNLKPKDNTWVNITQPQISARYNDTGSGIDINGVFIFLDSVNQTVNATITASQILLTPPSPLAQDVHTVFLIVSDLYGSQNSTTWQFYVDSIPPDITDSSPAQGIWVNSSQPTLNAKYSDSGSGIRLTGIFLFLDGINQTTNSSITMAQITHTPFWPIAEGIHNVFIVVTDNQNNQNWTTWQFYLDSISPVAEAGFDQAADEDEVIAFDGSASSDENELYNYTWDMGNGDFVYGANPMYSYDNLGTYIVTLTVRDIANNTATDTITVYINNLAPGAEAGGDQIVDEGDTVLFDGSGSTDTSSDTPSLLYTWYFPDGSVLFGSTVNYVFPDDGNYTVTLVVQDDNGYSDSDGLTVQVNNVAPVADIGGPYFAGEGSAVSLAGSAVDPGDDVLTFDWDFDDSDGITYTDASGEAPTWIWTDDWSGTIYLKVTDDDGGQNTDSTTVSIFNIAPTAHTGGPYSGDEGAQITLAGTADDPGADILAFEWDLDNDGLYDEATGDAPLWTWSDDGVFIIGLRVTDDDGGVHTNSSTVTVFNVAPVPDAGGPYSGDEGDMIQFTGSANDPGTADTISYLWDFGDGSNSTQQDSTHVYADDGVYVVTLTVTDDDGAGDSVILTVTINNVAPQASAGGPYSGTEGSPVAFSGSATDPGTDTLTYAWDFDDSDGVAYQDAAGPNPNWIWPDDFSGTVYLRVTDDDGGMGTSTASVTIINADPVADAGGPYEDFEEIFITFTGSQTDPGSQDTFTYSWDFGDGDTSLMQNPTHSYDDDAEYTLTLTVTDDDGGSDTDMIEVTINNAAPKPDAGGPYVEDEGVTFDIAGSAEDSAADILTYEWDLDDDGLYDDAVGQNPDVTFTDDGVYLIALRVTDDDGGVGWAATTVTINNIVPTANANGPYSANEGLVIIFNGTGTDPGSDTLTYLWDFGDGFSSTQEDPWHIYSDNGIYTVTLIVSDGDGGTGYDSEMAIINNLPPEFEDVDGVQTAYEDQPFALRIVATDAQGDTITFTDSSDLFTIDPTTGQISFTPANGDSGIKQVTITASDDDSATATMNVFIDILNVNDAPQLSDIGPQVASEDTAFALTVLATDIDSDDVLAFYDDAELFDIDADTGEISFTPANSDVGIYTVKITVTDSEGAFDSETFLLTIMNTNDAPELTEAPDQQARVGEPFAFTATASDVDDANLMFSDDSELFVIDPVTGVISFTPEKDDAGTHTVTITATDSQGISDSQTFTIDIEGVKEKEEGPDWMSIVLLILLVVLIILLLLHLLMHRRKEEPEPEPLGTEMSEIEEDIHKAHGYPVGTASGEMEEPGFEEGEKVISEPEGKEPVTAESEDRLASEEPEIEKEQKSDEVPEGTVVSFEEEKTEGPQMEPEPKEETPPDKESVEEKKEDKKPPRPPPPKKKKLKVMKTKEPGRPPKRKRPPRAPKS
jgi:PKD repeat protein